MKIGIVGSGKIGATLARLWVDQGHELALANRRGPETLGDLVAELGEHARADSVEGTAQFADLVLVALPVAAYPELPADALAGKLVVDAGNYYPARDGQIAELDSGALTSSEWLAGHLPSSTVVKAFNTMFFRTLAAEGRPGAPREERLALFVAGDDEAAKRTVIELVEAIGFAAVDTGSLAEGRRQEPGAPVYNNPMRAAQAEAALA